MYAEVKLKPKIVKDCLRRWTIVDRSWVLGDNEKLKGEFTASDDE